LANRVEDAKRLRYIRILQRFVNSIVAYLSKSENLSHEAYQKRIANNMRYYEKTEAIQLYKGEYTALEALVKKMIAAASSEEDIETVKNDILRDANKLEQSSNSRKYKKDKHKNAKFDEWR